MHLVLLLQIRQDFKRVIFTFYCLSYQHLLSSTFFIGPVVIAPIASPPNTFPNLLRPPAKLVAAELRLQVDETLGRRQTSWGVILENEPFSQDDPVSGYRDVHRKRNPVRDHRSALCVCQLLDPPLRLRAHLRELRLGLRFKHLLVVSQPVPNQFQKICRFFSQSTPSATKSHG